MNLGRLLNPRSIAVIGASREPGKLGRVVLENIWRYGFFGPVYPVNPNTDAIDGVKTFPAVSKLPDGIDLAVVVTPAKTVPGIVEACGRRGIKNVIVISAGFKEVGGDGAALESKLVATSRRYGLNLLGPNCLGILRPAIGLNASFAAGMPRKGSVALVSQSGAMAVAIADWAAEQEFGFSTIVSLGNKSVVNEADVLSTLARDPDTRVILLYLESVADAPRFLAESRRLAQRKPIVVVKAGRSDRTAGAIRSHTGSLAGSEEAAEAAFASAGIISVSRIEDLFDLARAFSGAPVPRGNRVAILTNAGGPGIMAADALAETPLAFAPLTAVTRATLKRKLPPAASILNPVDVVGDAPPERYRAALQALLRDRSVDSLVVILTPQYVTDAEAVAKTVATLRRTAPRKPILTSFVGGQRLVSAKRILNAEGVPNFEYPEEAVAALGRMWEYAVSRRRTRKPARQRAGISGKTRLPKKQLVVGPIAEETLRRSGIPVLPSVLVRDVRASLNAARRLRYPIVAKVISTHVVHKAAAGGVVTDISDDTSLTRAVSQLLKKFGRRIRGRGEGILLQPMLRGRFEVFVGAKRDVTFGPLVLVGVGGTHVEAFRDVTVRLAPISGQEASAMLGRGTLGRILAAMPKARRGLANILVQVGTLVVREPAIAELDLNPVLLDERSCVVADVRIVSR